ncbi:hypothetical protein H6771_03060 [Candidatus Peribacteria bacterium]|nr:hypothetical protein [Candidatus Peribacteria bacterium]
MTVASWLQRIFTPNDYKEKIIKKFYEQLALKGLEVHVVIYEVCHPITTILLGTAQYTFLEIVVDTENGNRIEKTALRARLATLLEPHKDDIILPRPYYRVSGGSFTDVNRAKKCSLSAISTIIECVEKNQYEPGYYPIEK